MIKWWLHNLTLKSTWAGIILITLLFLFRNDEIIKELLHNIVSDETFIQIIVGAISGAFIVHKPSVDNEK